MKTTNEIERHLTVLCDCIGARPTGSQANAAAVEYVCAEFEKSGLNVQRQTFKCIDWSQNDCSLILNNKKISIEPTPYSLACDVEGEIVCLKTIDELRKAQIKDKIVLLLDKLVSEPIMPKNFVFWNPDEHKEIISLLENGKPLAVLTSSLSSKSFVPIIEDGDFELPCGIIHKEDIQFFRSGYKASLKIITQRTPTTSSNVIATYGKGEHKVCFSAHIDTKAGTPGALDNASGVAVLLALASQLKHREYPYRVEFVIFNGEDYYSTPGEMTYLSTNLSNPKEFICAYNIDGVGLKEQKLSYSFYECPQKLIDNISKSALNYKDLEKIEPWPQGDHMLFAYSSVPAIAITSCGIFELVDSVLHTQNDIRDMIDINKLETLVSFLLFSI